MFVTSLLSQAGVSALARVDVPTRQQMTRHFACGAAKNVKARIHISQIKKIYIYTPMYKGTFAYACARLSSVGRQCQKFLVSVFGP